MSSFYFYILQPGVGNAWADVLNEVGSKPSGSV